MKLTSIIKPLLLAAAATLPSCTTVVEPPTPAPTTTVHRESRTSTVYPLDATRTQTTTTIHE
jgi:hypothetical protein